MQVSGKGELIEEGASGYVCGWEAINFESFFRALGRDLKYWPEGHIILKVTPNQIVLFELGLLAKGYAARQVWQAKD